MQNAHTSSIHLAHCRACLNLAAIRIPFLSVSHLPIGVALMAGNIDRGETGRQFSCVSRPSCGFKVAVMTCVLWQPYHLLACEEHLIVLTFLFINQLGTPHKPVVSHKRDQGVAAELPNDVHVVAEWCNPVLSRHSLPPCEHMGWVVRMCCM